MTTAFAFGRPLSRLAAGPVRPAAITPTAAGAALFILPELRSVLLTSAPRDRRTLVPTGERWRPEIAAHLSPADWVRFP